MQEQFRNSGRDDFVPRRTAATNDVTGQVGSVLQRATAASLREIDDLIRELRRRREELLSESTRVQNEIMEYAKLSHTALQSTRIIAERLGSLNRDARSTRETPVDSEPEQDGPESQSGQFAQADAHQPAAFSEGEGEQIPQPQPSQAG
jgi:hypothetical protein